MKRSTFINIILIIALWPATVSAQFLPERRADILYDNLFYSKAASIYESLHNKHPENGKYIQRLAYCYDKMLNYKKALEYYTYLVQINEHSLTDYYQYAQLLRIDGKIEDAKLWLDKYLQLVPDDKRALSQYNQLKELISLKEKIHYIEIKEVEGNTHFTDMCPLFFEDRLIFASSRDSFSMIRNEFKWNGQPFLKLFVTQPNAEPDLFQSSLFSKKLHTRIHEGPACFSSDFNTIYFTRNSHVGSFNKKSPGRINNLKIFVSKLDGEVWSDPVEFAFNSDLYSVGHPALSPDNKTLYFISDMPGGYGATDIYKSELVDGQWSKPENLGAAVNTEGKEMFPSVDKDGTLYFSSNGRPGMGSLDIFAARADENGHYMIAGFGAPLNSSYDDFGLTISPYSLSGYFTSNRPGGQGEDDIYSFSVPAVNLLVKSKLEGNNEYLSDTRVYLKAEDGEIITSAMTNLEGLAQFTVKPGQQYRISAENNTCASEIIPVTIAQQLFDLDQTEELLLRENNPFLTLQVVSQETGEKIQSAIVDIAEGQMVESSRDQENGIIRMKMNNSTDYVFHVSAEGYLPNTFNYSTVGKSPGDYSLTVELEKLNQGSMFTLSNLYYDLNKADIRPEATTVLNKLVDFMLENPEARIEIGSHTDCRAGEDYNFKLSQRRSESVVNYLIDKGISPDRLIAKGYGEQKLVNKCAEGINCPEEAHQANRRTEIEILDYDPSHRHITSL